MNLEELGDRMEIQDALLAYSTALDTPGRRWDLWFDCFTEDAMCEYRSTGLKTATELRELFKQNDAIRLSTQHLIMNIVVSVDGDTASARSECLYAAVNRGADPGSRVLTLSGLWFEDTCIRTEKGWRVNRRIAHPRWSLNTELDAEA